MAFIQREVLAAHKIKILYSLTKSIDLSDWELRFLKGVTGLDFLSMNQEIKLNEIYGRLRFGGQLWIPEVLEHWDEVHDFDRG